MNTFGTAQLKFGLCEYDPTLRKRFRRDEILAKANTFYCDRQVARGWILLPRSEYLQFDAYATNFTLTLGNLVLKNLSLVQAHCVSTGVTSDSNSLYLIEVTDARGILSNRWFQQSINAQYNMRAPAYPQQLYGTMTYTWSTMIADLWPVLLGAYPGLPVVPNGTPENWQFIGMSRWEALNKVLSHLGLMLAVDLTSATPYTIVVDGAADASFLALQQLYAKNLEDDLQWIDAGSGRFPSSVVVYFRIRAEQYGQEETVRRDSLQWTSTPLYAISIATGYASVGSHFLHDDFTVRVDYDGIANVLDAITASTIATERVIQYLQTIDSSMTQTYAKALPFYVGSQVDKVCWSGPCWRTTIMRGNDAS